MDQTSADISRAQSSMNIDITGARLIEFGYTVYDILYIVHS